MRKEILIITFLISLVPCSTFADFFIPDPIDIEWMRVYKGDNPGHLVKTGVTWAWEGCAATKNSGIYYLPAGSKEAYSMLLAAKLANRPVKLHVDGYANCQGGATGYAIIVEVHLE